MKSVAIALMVILAVLGFFALSNTEISQSLGNNGEGAGARRTQDASVHPLSIQALRNGTYPGSDFVVEETLSPGSNYTRSIVSYKSEGLKIYALLTVPVGQPPAGGWPAVVFNHGYIPPAEYRTTERYIAYTDAISRAGYVLLRPDYRGHGNSEGIATGGYGTNDYTIDVLNAVSSLKRYPGVNTSRIGMWGHSMGGHITLRTMVTNGDVKAGIIWAGVVASYPDLVNNWRRPSPGQTAPTRASRWRQSLVAQYGEPSEESPFWRSISSNAFLSDISGPIQIHHGTADTSVPSAFSESLHKQLQDAEKSSELFLYPGDDHNISANFSAAMSRSVSFFDKHLKL